MHEIPVSLGEWVQQLRGRLGLTRKELALKVGCSPVTIKKIERDERNPSHQIAELLAVHLQLGPGQYDAFMRKARGEYVEGEIAADAERDDEAYRPLVYLPEKSGLLIGREPELERLTVILSDPAQMLVTLVGSGGIGKSQLALWLAHLLREEQPALFTDGVVWVDFTAHKEGSHIVPAIAKALKLPIEKEARLPEKQLLDWLRLKNMLLIFDNFDHLIDESGFVSNLLGVAPAVKVLVTSRQRLNLQEEQVFPVEGLGYPQSVDALHDGSYAAIDLFVETARKVEPNFQLTVENAEGVVKLCQLVAGMPLSIQMAAAWVDMLSTAEIADEIKNSLDFLETNLRNFPERHKSIRAVFDASWEKLSAREKKIFGRLSIFQGGFSRQAAGAVSGASLTVLARLVDRSLIHYDSQQEQYHLNELLRQYGEGQFTEHESVEAQNDLHERHSIYYLELLAEFNDQIKGKGQQTAISQIGRDLKNVRMAWRWAIDHAKTDLIKIGMEPLANFLEFKGRYREGEATFLTMAKALGKQSNPILHLKALAFLSVFEFSLDKIEKGERSLAAAIEIIDELVADGKNVDRERAFVYALMGHSKMSQDVIEAENCFLKALDLYRSLGMAWEQASMMTMIGSAVRLQANFSEAHDWLSKSLAIRQSEGDLIGAAETLATLSELSRNQGKFYEAILLAQNSVDLARQIQNDNVLALGLAELAMAAYYEGSFAKQHQYLLESLALFQDQKNVSMLPLTYFRLCLGNAALGQFESATINAQRGLNLARETGNQFQTALLLKGEAIVALATGYYDSGKQILEESLTNFADGIHQADRNSAVALLGFAEYHIGNPTPAKRCFCEALKTAIALNDPISLILTYSISAVVLSDEGELEKAIILWEMVKRLSWPFQKSAWNRNLFGDRLNAVQESLTAEQIETIEAHVQRNSLWDEAANLLAHIEAKEWNRPPRA